MLGAYSHLHGLAHDLPNLYETPEVSVHAGLANYRARLAGADPLLETLMNLTQPAPLSL